MIQIPILGAFLEATGTLIEKRILKNKKISSSTYTTFSFLAIVLVMIPFIWFFWRANSKALTIGNLLLFALVVISAVAANLLTYYSLKREKISEFEPIWLMQPLFTILLAFFIYGSERKFAVLIFALIASLSLIAAHVKKHHVNFDKYSISLILGCLFFAIELVASKPILNFYSPFAFYFIRCLFIFIIIFMIYRPKWEAVGNKNSLLILLVGIMWVFYRIILYYGYLSYGIIFTTTLFILAPVFLLIMAAIFLKEKMTVRQIISTIIIIACVAASIYFGN
jgi:drug/metabolite transporter (DMT)-like permease